MDIYVQEIMKNNPWLEQRGAEKLLKVYRLLVDHYQKTVLQPMLKEDEKDTMASRTIEDTANTKT